MVNEIDPVRWYTIKELANKRLIFGYTSICSINNCFDNGINGVIPRHVNVKGTVRKIQGKDLMDFIEKCKSN